MSATIALRQSLPTVGRTDPVWKDVEEFQPVIPTNEQSFSPQTSAQKTFIELEEYIGTLEESSNAFIRFKQSQETLGRCMAEMFDEICNIFKMRNGELT